LISPPRDEESKQNPNLDGKNFSLYLSGRGKGKPSLLKWEAALSTTTEEKNLPTFENQQRDFTFNTALYSIFMGSPSRKENGVTLSSLIRVGGNPLPLSSGEGRKGPWKAKKELQSSPACAEKETLLLLGSKNTSSRRGDVWIRRERGEKKWRYFRHAEEGGGKSPTTLYQSVLTSLP